MGEEAKKKFTFKIVCLYIEDVCLFDQDCDQNKRMEHLRKIEKSIEYSGFKFYYSLFENVKFYLIFFSFIK